MIMVPSKCRARDAVLTREVINPNQYLKSTTSEGEQQREGEQTSD